MNGRNGARLVAVNAGEFRARAQLTMRDFLQRPATAECGRAKAELHGVPRFPGARGKSRQTA